MYVIFRGFFYSVAEASPPLSSDGSHSGTMQAPYEPRPYMWSDPVSSGPTDIGLPNTCPAWQTESPDMYEFWFFAFAKS